MKSRALPLLFLVLPIALICTSLGCFKSDRYAHVQKSRMKYTKIAVSHFTVSPEGVAEDDMKNILKHLKETRSECVDVLKDSGLYEKVFTKSSPESAAANLLVQGELHEMRIVGTATRDWIGWTAGKSGMSIHIKLVDAKTGAFVAEQRFGGHVSGRNVADADLTKLIGQQIGEFIIQTTIR